MATKFDPNILGPRMDNPVGGHDGAAEFSANVRQSAQGSHPSPQTNNTGVSSPGAFLPPGQFVAPAAGGNPVASLVAPPMSPPPAALQAAAIAAMPGNIPLGVAYGKGYQAFVGTAGRSGGAYDTMTRELDETNSTII